MRKLWCISCAKTNRVVEARFLVDDDPMCDACAKRESETFGVDLVAIPVSDPVPAPVAEKLPTKPAPAARTPRKRPHVPSVIKEEILSADIEESCGSLAKRLGVSQSLVTKTRRQAGIRTGDLRRVSDEVRKAICEADPTETNAALARRFGVSDMAVSAVRKEACVVTPQRRGVRIPEGTKRAVAEAAPLHSIRQLAQKFGIGEASVVNICRNAGVSTLGAQSSKEVPVAHTTAKRSSRYTPEVIEAIRSAGPEITNSELCRKYGVSDGYCSQLRSAARRNQHPVRKSAKPEQLSPVVPANPIYIELSAELADTIWTQLSLSQKASAIQHALQPSSGGAR